MKDYPKNPGKLPVLKLCNKIKRNCPKTDVKPLGPLGGKHNIDAKLMKHLQSMLIALGYDLGTTGVDGDFGKLTRNAVIDFQKEKKDWEGKELNEDGLVGPRTADAFNRAMVGKWYDEYTTPKELTNEKRILTVTSKFMSDTGTLLEHLEHVEKIKVILKGPLPSGSMHKLIITLLDANGDPQPDVHYILKVGELTYDTHTDSEGCISNLIPTNIDQGTLIIDGQEIVLNIGGLAPIEQLIGVQARLNNLGYDCGPPTDKMNAETVQALRRFQALHALEVTGQVTPETRGKLKEIYGH